MGNPRSFSLSPYNQNSANTFSVHYLYISKLLVGLETSLEWTIKSINLYLSFPLGSKSATK